MGLLDTDALKQYFGYAFSGIYGTGRLIRVEKVRGPGGVMINRYHPPETIKVQVDRCDEAMRKQSGFTDSDVKLLVLQSGVSSPAPTTDDVIEAKGVRWNMYATGEDPASTHWRGRGVRKSPVPENGWMFEYGHWDDDAEWRNELRWLPISGPFELKALPHWAPQEQSQATILALIEAGGGDITNMNWQKAATELGNVLGMSILPGDNAGQIRQAINARI